MADNFTLYDSSEYIGHCYVKCYPEQQKEVMKWMETIRREVLPENIFFPSTYISG